jgi:hypothetical protein
METANPRSKRSSSCARCARRLCAFVIAIISFCIAPAMFAQSATATLSGTVEDQNGAVVAAVSITLRNVDTGLKREATTNEDGAFTVPLLPPGKYVVQAQREGFQRYEFPGVVLNVGDQKALKIRLKTGDVNEKVEVATEASLINESATVGTVIDRRFVSDLPLNGRSFQSLINLTPGVVITQASALEQGQFSVNGQRADANYFTVDGVSANLGVSTNSDGLGQSAAGALPGLTAFGGTNNLVSIDALQEFKILTSTFAPQYGRTPGGQVSVVTRSGTNQFHGTVFEYFRNDALDANDWFANQKRLAKPALRQNDFGGVLGGPIIKDHLLFFFSYEGLRLRLPQTRVNNLVPSLAARNAAVPSMQSLLKAFPVPNGRDLGNGTAEFNATYSDPSRLDATGIRIDYAPTGRISFFGRYNHAPSESTQRPSVLSALSTGSSRTRTLTIGSAQNLSAMVTNELRFNYSRAEAHLFNVGDNFGGAVAPSISDLLPTGVDAQHARFILLILGGPGAYFLGEGANNKQRQINLVDDLSVTRGNHEMKFGVDFRTLKPNAGPTNYQEQGLFLSVQGANGAATPRTAISGSPFQTIVTVGEAVPLLYRNFSVYGQDAWRVSSRLTATYGLRWDINPAPRGADGLTLTTVQGLNNPATMTLAPAGTPLYHTSYHNFAPRLGLSYELFHSDTRSTLLRGGIGIFYDLGAGSLGNIASNFPHSTQLVLFGGTFPLTTPPPAINRVPPVGVVYVADPDLQLPRIYQWNASVEQGLTRHESLTVTYVGALGRRLLRQDNLVAPNSLFNSLINVTRNGATSDYHALQVQLNRRLSRGLQLLASYTWSHSIDIASNDSNIAGFTPNSIVVGAFDPRIDRGSSDFDIRHSFSSALSYNIPEPKWDRKWKVLRDWSVDLIGFARSAPPVDLTAGSLFGAVTTNAIRPDIVAGKPFYLQDPNVPGGRRLNAAAFAAPPQVNFSVVRQGTLGRNVFRGYGAWQLDAALHRVFKIHENFNLQLQAEAFNLFNHPNFGSPNTNVADSQFGLSSAMLGRTLGTGTQNGGFSPLYQIGGPRSMQLVVKLNF